MTVQKNRYLQLDGTPVESREWRRYVSPWTLATGLTGAFVAMAFPTEQTKLPPYALLSAAAAGIAIRGTIRHSMIKDFNKTGLQNYVIDTAPEAHKHACTDKELNFFLYKTKSNALIGSTVGLGFIGYSFATLPAVEALAQELCITSPIFAHTFEGYYLASKVEKSQWAVIGRGQMAQQQEQMNVAPALTHVK